MKMTRFAVTIAITTVVSLMLSSCGRPAQRITVPFSVVEASIPEMQNAMAAGRTTSREIVTQYFTRIGLYEETLNAAASINGNALVQADSLDQERAAGKVRGPLHGIPVALKDNIMTKGELPTSGGMLAFKHYVAPYDATLVTNLKAAGAIIIAKSNLVNAPAGLAPTGGPAAAVPLRRPELQPLRPAADEDGTHCWRSELPVRVADAANLWAANVGTSTGGSMEGPSTPPCSSAFGPRRGASAVTASCRSASTRTPPAP